MAVQLLKNQTLYKEKVNLKQVLSAQDISGEADPYAAIDTGKKMIRAWARQLQKDQLHYAQSFMLMLMETYWAGLHAGRKNRRKLPLLFSKITIKKLDAAVQAVAVAIGTSAVQLPVNDAGYLLGSVYTAVLPEETRSAGGVFYTPPALSERLINLAQQNGVNWSSAKVIDPACGGGAFLAPLCNRMIKSLSGKNAVEKLLHIQTHLHGWEIDPFAGWMTQVFVEIVLIDLLAETNFQLKPVVRIVNSLEVKITAADKFDLVIGNPPFGKLKLTNALKERFSESLYGHPNLYGLFTHLALDLCAPDAVIAWLTPASFLSGEYFKKLRQHLRKFSSLNNIDFVAVRKGVFEDVLQETVLTLHGKGQLARSGVQVSQVTTLPGNELKVEEIGTAQLPLEPAAPWILPRSPQQKAVVDAMQNMTARLGDWGYKVSTGPLVWNRHKKQLTEKAGHNTYPVIWAEAITAAGKFILKAEKINHKTFFKWAKGNEWLLNTKPCILLQRTTAKEQDKRLIAAALPSLLVKKGVVIENHLNMVIAKNGKPLVAPEVLAVLLNSKIVNLAFRTISGSVAVSAYELEALPLPSVDQVQKIAVLIAQKESADVIEKACESLYWQP